MLEHLKNHEVDEALQRWYKILKPGGTLRISVPDIKKAFAHYLLYEDLDFIRCMLWGSQKHDFDFHYTGWSFKELNEVLTKWGFRDVITYNHNNTEHGKIDDYSAAYYPYRAIADKDNASKSILMSLNVEAKKPHV